MTVSCAPVSDIDYYLSLSMELLDLLKQDGDPDIGQPVLPLTEASGTQPGSWWSPTGWLVQDGAVVQSMDLRTIARGYSPENGQPLVQTTGARHAAAYDLTFSVPKSVSVLWALGHDQQRLDLSATHVSAVRSVLPMLLDECLVETRRGKGGRLREVPESIVVALMPHTSARPVVRHASKARWSSYMAAQLKNRDRQLTELVGDPQLHVHALIMNVCRRADGTTGAIDNRRLMNYRHALDAAYQAALANGLRTLGLSVVVDEKYRLSARVTPWRVLGVPRAVCETFSARRHEIETALCHDALGPPSARAIQVATLATRCTKSECVTAWQQRVAWNDKLQALGFTSSAIWALALAESVGPAVDPVQAAHDAMTAALERMERSRIVIERPHIFEEALRRSISGMTYEHVREALEAALIEGRLVETDGTPASSCYITSGMLIAEKHMLATAKRLSVREVSVDRRILDDVLAGGRLSSTEQHDVRRGLGAGSMTIMDVNTMTADLLINCAWRIADFSGGSVTSLGDDAEAAEFALDAAGADSAKLSPDKWRLVVVRETHRLSAWTMSRLLARVERIAAQLVLIADLSPRSGGSPLKSLACVIGTNMIRDAWVPNQAWLQTAVRTLATGHVLDALRAFDARGLLRLANDATSAMTALLESYASDLIDDPEASQLVICATYPELRAATAELRDLRRRSGLLRGPEVVVEAQPQWRGQGRTTQLALAIGDHLVCNEQITCPLREDDVAKLGQDAVLSAGSRLVVMAIKPTSDTTDPVLDLRTEQGNIVVARWKELVRIERRRSRSVPRIQHAYAVTAGMVGGQVADRTYVLAARLQWETALVACTAHREHIRLVVDAAAMAKRTAFDLPEMPSETAENADFGAILAQSSNIGERLFVSPSLFEIFKPGFRWSIHPVAREASKDAEHRDERLARLAECWAKSTSRWNTVDHSDVSHLATSTCQQQTHLGEELPKERDVSEVACRSGRAVSMKTTRSLRDGDFHKARPVNGSCP